MNRPQRILIGVVALLLGGCASDSIYQWPGPPQRPPTSPSWPAPPPEAPARPVITPVTPAPKVPAQPSTGKTHPRYAPPPHLDAQWDNRLGVYVVSGRALYYRERLYYRWSNGWYCAGQPDGPWKTLEDASVPMGLRSLH